MKKAVTCAMATALTACMAVFALPMGEKIYLWPDGKMPDPQDHQIAATTEEAKAPGFDRAANRMPHVQWFDAVKDTPKTDTSTA